MALVSFLLGGRMTVTRPSSLALLLYMAFISSAAYTLWGLLLKYHPVSHVSIFTFVTPIAGVILSSLVLQEKGALNLSVIAALILVCLGIFTVSKE
ncbi:MAG: EamA family transporter, partial [Eubacteriales bacterium]|nr:EamA family transporter [Eubacteriales bacterium]